MNLGIKRLSLDEKASGFSLKKMSLKLVANNKQTNIDNFTIELPDCRRNSSHPLPTYQRICRNRSYGRQKRFQGYVYLGSVNGAGKSISLGDYSGMKEAFVKNGTLASSKTKWITRREENTPAMAYVHNFGTVTKDGKDGFLMIGYDDI